MKVNKFYVILLLMAVFTFSMVFMGINCNAEEKKPFEGAEITIPVLAGPPGEAVKEFAPEFEALSGMKINIEILSHDEMWKKMELDAASGGKNFDAYHINYFKLDEYRNSGAIIPLKQYIEGDISPYSDPEWDDYAKALIDAMSAREGDYWAIPHMGDTRLLWYNKEKFEEAGLSRPPDTWEEYIEYGKKMTKEDGSQYGAGNEFQKYIYAIDMFNAFLLPFGGSFFDENWNSQINSPEGKKALQYMYDLIHKYKIVPPDVVNWGHTELTNAIVTGYVAMVTQWHCFIPEAENPDSSLVAGKLGYALVPGVKQLDGSIRRRDSLGCWGFAISSGSKYPEATYAFLEWLKSPEIDVRYALAGGTSTRVSTNNDPRVVKEIPYAPLIGQSLSEVTRPFPIIPNFTEWSEAIGTEINKALVDQVTIEKALINCDNISNKLMENIGYKK